MTSEDEIKTYTVPDVEFSIRLKRILSGFFIVLCLIEIIVLFTSKHPIRDSISLFFVTSIFCFLLFILPGIKSVSAITLTEDLIEIKGRFINTIYYDSFNIKNVTLSVNALGKGMISGYELAISANKKKYLLSPNNGWETIELCKILIDIKDIRAQFNINREDGTNDIPEIERFLYGREK